MSNSRQPRALAPWREWLYPGAVLHVALSSNGQRVAFSGDAGSIEVWERTEAQWHRLFTFLSPSGDLPIFALSPDGTRLAMAGPEQRDIQVFLAENGQSIARFRGMRGSATCMTWSPRGDVASGSDDGWVYVWDWEKAHEAFAFKNAYKANPDVREGKPIRAIAWSPDGELLTTIEENDPFVCAYHYLQKVWKQTGCRADGEPACAVAWRPDGKQLAIVYGSQIEIRARQHRKAALRTLVGHATKVIAVNWSDDGRFIFSLAQDGELRVWDAQTGHLVGQLNEEGDEHMQSMAVGAGGLVLVGGRNWCVRLYDVLTLVGYRVSAEKSRELTRGEAWSFVQCVRCFSSGDRAAYRNAAQVQEIARIEAKDAVCSTCHIVLATGKLAPTGHPLKDLFSRDLSDLLVELDVDGWTQGGCWVAAKGLLRWIETSPEPPEARLMVVEAKQQPAHRIADHVVVELVVAGERLCLDVDGVARSGDFLNAWARSYKREACVLVPFDEQRLRRLEYRYDADMSDHIADTLHETFGEFREALLPPFARKNEG